MRNLTAQDQWTFGANDPDFMGWVTFAAYLAAAAACFACSRQLRGSVRDDLSGRQQRTFWRISALVLLLLGFNKQLDLQTPIIAGAKYLAKAEGWYSLRGVVRWLCVGILAAAGLVVVAWGTWKLRHARFEYGLACAGLVLLLAYVVFRASPIEHVNRFLNWSLLQVGGRRHILELAGVSCVGIGAAAEFIRRRDTA